MGEQSRDLKDLSEAEALECKINFDLAMGQWLCEPDAIGKMEKAGSAEAPRYVAIV